MNFPKNLRIRQKREYLEFFQGSEVKKLGPCVVYRRESKADSARLGITLKVNSGSVMRNKLKRQIRESFRLNHAGLGKHDYNVVVSGRYPINYSTPKQVRHKLESIWANESRF